MIVAVHAAHALLLPLIGLTLGVLAGRALRPTPTRASVLWALSLVCACLGLACWPLATAGAIDRVTHVPGLGHLATDTFTSASFVAQFAFTCVVGDCWTPRRRVAVVVYGALVGLYGVLWLAVHTTYNVYDSYSGWPAPVLTMNLTLVVLLGYAATLGIYGYIGWLRGDADSSERLVAAGATTVFALAVVYAVLVLGQTVASVLGLGSTQIMSVTGPITVTAGVIAAGVIWLLTGARTRPVRAYVQAVVALRQREAEVEERERRVAAREDDLTQLKGDIADLAVWVEDHLVQIHAEVDQRPLNDLSAWCAANDIPASQRKVALTVMRLVLLGQARVLRLPRYDLTLLPDEDEGDPGAASVARDLPGEVDEDETFLSDVLRVLYLADPHPLPEGITPREEPDGWRRVVATAMAHALRRYGHDRRSASA